MKEPKEVKNIHLGDGIVERVDTVAVERLSNLVERAINLTSYPEFEWPDVNELCLLYPEKSQPDFDSFVSHVMGQYEERNISRLCEFYGIDSEPNDCGVLLQVLLRKYVPGFCGKPKAGAPQKWSKRHLLFLYSFVELRRSEPNAKDVTVICGNVRNWPQSLIQVFPSSGALRQYYYEARSDNEITNYVTKQKEVFGDRWFELVLSGELKFDYSGMKAKEAFPPLIEADKLSNNSK